MRFIADAARQAAGAGCLVSVSVPVHQDGYAIEVISDVGGPVQVFLSGREIMTLRCLDDLVALIGNKLKAIRWHRDLKDAEALPPSAARERNHPEREAEIRSLLTLLRDETQSRSVHERCTRLLEQT